MSLLIYWKVYCQRLKCIIFSPIILNDYWRLCSITLETVLHEIIGIILWYFIIEIFNKDVFIEVIELRLAMFTLIEKLKVH